MTPPRAGEWESAGQVTRVEVVWRFVDIGRDYGDDNRDRKFGYRQSIET